MNKVIPLLILFCLILSAPTAFAQSSYVKGYIVTTDKDTVKGWVDHRGNFKDFRQCNFKKDEQEERQEFLPQNILGYGVPGSKHFISKKIIRDGATKDVFLEYLVDGNVDLYYYQEESNDDAFFIERDGVLYELKDELFTKQIDGRTYSAHTNEYRNTLKTVLNDKTDFWPSIDRAYFDRKSLTNLITDYHALCDGCHYVQYYVKEKPLKITFIPVVGMSYSTSTLAEYSGGYAYIDYIRDSIRTNYSVTNKATCTSPVVGLKLNFTNVMNSIGERFSIDVDLLYGSTKYDFARSYYYSLMVGNQGTGYTTEGSNVHNMAVTLSQKLLKTYLRVKYSVPNGKVRPNLSAGFHYNLVFSKSVQYTITDVNDPLHDYATGNPLSGADNAQGFLNFGIGAAIGSISHPIHVNFMIDTQLGGTNNISYTDMGVTVGYQF